MTRSIANPISRGFEQKKQEKTVVDTRQCQTKSGSIKKASQIYCKDKNICYLSNGKNKNMLIKSSEIAVINHYLT